MQNNLQCCDESGDPGSEEADGDSDNGFEFLESNFMCVCGDVLQFKATPDERRHFKQEGVSHSCDLTWVICCGMFTLKLDYLFRSTDTMACRGTSTDSGETRNSCLPRGGGNLRPGLVALMTFSLCLPFQ